MHTILYAALRSRLDYQIQKALCPNRNPGNHPVGQNPIGLFPNSAGEWCSGRANADQPLNRRGKKQLEFPLKQIRPSQLGQLEYVSAVALKYASNIGQSPLQLAEDLVETLIVECCSTENDPNSETTWRCPSQETLLKILPPSRERDYTTPTNSRFCFMSWFRIEVMPPGWIYFRLLPEGLSNWLQHLVDGALPRLGDTSNRSPNFQPCNLTAASARNSTRIFPIVHTYARCHSFLRLGQQLGLLEGKLGSSADRNTESGSGLEPDLAPDALWQIQQPHPFPWRLPDGRFRSSHPAEWQLVEQICATLDALAKDEIQRELGESPDSQAVLKQADRLTQAWQTFYGECRIADSTRYLDPAQAQIRLGLTCITQKLLHGLLRSIGLPTPLFL